MRSAPCTSWVGPPWCPTISNDEGVVAGPDGRYNLGLSEWRDIEAAIDHAARLGAPGDRPRRIVEIGGAIVLQFLDRSPLSQLVDGVVLDGPVIDWGDVLAHHEAVCTMSRTRSSASRER